MRYSILAWYMRSPEFNPHQASPPPHCHCQNKRKLCGTAIYGDNSPEDEDKMNSRNSSVILGHSYSSAAASCCPMQALLLTPWAFPAPASLHPHPCTFRVKV